MTRIMHRFEILLSVLQIGKVGLSVSSKQQLYLSCSYTDRNFAVCAIFVSFCKNGCTKAFHLQNTK